MVLGGEGCANTDFRRSRAESGVSAPFTLGERILTTQIPDNTPEQLAPAFELLASPLGEALTPI